MTTKEQEINDRALELRDEIKRLTDDIVKNAASTPKEQNDPFLRMSANLTVLNMLFSSLSATFEMKLKAELSDLISNKKGLS